MDAAGRNPWTESVTMTDLLSLPLRDAIDIPIADLSLLTEFPGARR